MDTKQEISPAASGATVCLNCGESMQGNFCRTCGQKNKDNADRSLAKLLGELLTNIFFLDNRLWVSLRYLFLRPGAMTREYLEGKRRKFLSPISIFLFANLLYFFANPITDYSLPLHDQMQRQMHSPFARELVQKRLEARDVPLEVYSESYNQASLNLSKSIMIANVPLFALFLWPVFYRRRKYYYDTLIFGLHFFSLFLFILVIGDGLHKVIQAIGIPISEGMILVFGVLVLPIILGAISARAFVQMRWIFASLVGIAVILGLAFSQFIYRALIFFLTFAMT